MPSIFNFACPTHLSSFESLCTAARSETKHVARRRKEPCKEMTRKKTQNNGSCRQCAGGGRVEARPVIKMDGRGSFESYSISMIFITTRKPKQENRMQSKQKTAEEVLGMHWRRQAKVPKITDCSASSSSSDRQWMTYSFISRKC